MSCDCWRAEALLNIDKATEEAKQYVINHSLGTGMTGRIVVGIYYPPTKGKGLLISSKELHF